MNRRFSARRLHDARNHIPIRHVIESLLGIPSETVRGVFRFRCPLCGGRHTSIKPDTNLSRCFDCGRNFNAIDLCMLVRRANFVESVRFLTEHESLLPPTENRYPSGNDETHLEPKREHSKMPVALTGILAKLIGNGLEGGLNPRRKETPRERFTPNDIAEIERIVHALSQILQRLKSNHSE